ncbi:MAG: V-type ATP synthase subunit K [Clostridium sp.]|jgi:V/A-type H+-transporting ATPase subunit K|nr:V-type ATP synthase subunit K [Clostridium sp.]
MGDFIQNYGGDLLAILGATIAFVLAGIGSTKGVYMAGEAGAGVLTEEPGRFGAVMVLQALPSTQAIYGFVIAFLTLQKVTGTPLPVVDGLSLFIASLPVGIIGLVSGVLQGKVATAGIHMVAKRADGMVRGIILALMVEMFAIIGFIISILMLGKV